MKLTELYKSILNYCGMGANDHGEIDIIADPENIHPATIEGRRLVLPTQEQLKTYHPEKKVIFHPLQEHIDRGASDVVKKLQYLIGIRINNAIIEIGTDLLKLLGSAAIHKTLNPDQRQLIRAVGGADITSAANFVKFIAKPFTAAPASSITSIFLKKAGTYKGVKHSRVGIVSFPIHEHIEAASIKVGDKETYHQLIEFMFPGSTDENTEEYNSFSDSKDAPWLDVMLKTSYTLTERLNQILDEFGDFIENKETLRFNTDWLDGMDNAEQFRAEIRRIPDQRGNEGSITKPGGEEEAVIQPKREEAPRRPETSVVPTPAPREKPGGPYREAEPPQYPQAYHDPRYPQPPYPPAAYPPPGYPPTGYPPAGYPPAGYQAPPAPRHAVPGPDGKITLQAIESVNPAVTAAGMMPTPLLNSAWASQMQQHQHMPYPPPGYPIPGHIPGYGPAYGVPVVDRRVGAPQMHQQYSYPGVRGQWGAPDPRTDPRFAGGINPAI